MKFVYLRSFAAVCLLSLLTACGGSDFEAATPAAQAAAPASAMTQAAVAVAAPAAASGEPAATPAAQIAESNGQNPTADCEAEKCQGLRIIDGNAEAYRFDAIRGSTAEAGSGT
jgi:hypothetical protein